MTKLKCLLIGNGLLLAQCADILLDRGHAIAAIGTTHAQVRHWAADKIIPTFEPRGDYTGRVAAFEYDWLFSIANLQLVPEPVWRKARHGTANFHDGPLPRFAGLNTPSWAIIDGESRHGVTWHAMNAGLDEGDIFASQEFEIAPDETALTLNAKCYEAGMASFAAMLTDIEAGTLAPRPQDFSTRVYYGRHQRPPAAATLRFDRPADELSRLVRALDFGPGHDNTLTTPKIRVGEDVFTVKRLEVTDEPAAGKAGVVLAVDERGAVVGTADRPVIVEGSLVRNGQTVSLSSELKAGMRLRIPGAPEIASLTQAVAERTPHEAAFRRALAACTDVILPGIKEGDPAFPADIMAVPLPMPQALAGSDRIALVAAALTRLSGQREFDIAFRGAEIARLCSRHPGYFAGSVPLRITSAAEMAVGDFVGRTGQSVTVVRQQISYLRDLTERYPQLSPPGLSFGIVDDATAAETAFIEGCAVTFLLGAGQPQLLYDRARVEDERARDLVARFAVLAPFLTVHSAPFDELPLMSEDEIKRVLYEWNSSEHDYERHACVHELIERQVDLTPDAEAVSYRDQSLTYRELDDHANRIAHALVALGVGPDVLVGLHLPRSLDLVVGALAIQKAGGAYVPLDPDFPADRLAFMVRDSAARVVLTKRDLAGTLPVESAEVLCIEDVPQTGMAAKRLSPGVGSHNLAYVIYTSGSTGQPKGVMVEHRNVANFFAGMDDRVPRPSDRRNVWLAVTSLSFDISVLELFWTLTRGFKVVIHASEIAEGKAQGRRFPASDRPVDFGLFYWGNDGGAGPAKYRLLLEGAKFADRNGFQAIWTPERHFHAFGGPYPNPSVTGAAVAAVTSNLSIRAGSCVLPLHHPARVAEEWAVVDNISNGRVALAFASGWMPEDFVLRPENAPPNNKASLVRDIEVVRKLWRGEQVDFEFGDTMVGVTTLPRPVQKELPIWLTTAGNPESYREAARLGANVLTHLLGQTVDELAEKIRIYRETLVEVGRNPAEHTVTLMLHTLLGDDREEVRMLAREPMKDYLRSAAALIKQYAWAFPAFKKPQGVSQPMDIDLQSLSGDEMDAILEFAFLRYFDDSGLFGTVEQARERIEQVAAAGVDEIACLIDFGLPGDVILERLAPLATLVKEVRGDARTENTGNDGFAAEIGRHQVTHLQCTPSMARMFLMAPEDRAALGDVHHLFIGGEALPGSLVEDLRSVTAATVENMYGPTETTIWSSTCAAGPTPGVVPLGRPIANTQLYVLDATLKPVPPGMPGELFIGGDGVSRGYLNRKELSRERFLDNPFTAGRIYRTGDLVRYDGDGTLQFLGRTDHQVKVRGYRIELGEIEAQISSFPGIHEAIVIAREDQPGDVRIVAYLRTLGSDFSENSLRTHLADALPAYMVPAHFVVLEHFPLTPNAKVDRNRLPRPEEVRDTAPAENFVAPVDTLQRTIAETFRRALGLERIGIFDSFFALGGHSLLAVQVHRELKASLAPDLSITDLFRFPTVSALAGHLADRDKANEQLSKVADRAAMRRNALNQRRADPPRIRDAV